MSPTKRRNQQLDSFPSPRLPTGDRHSSCSLRVKKRSYVVLITPTGVCEGVLDLDGGHVDEGLVEEEYENKFPADLRTNVALTTS